MSSDQSLDLDPAVAVRSDAPVSQAAAARAVVTIGKAPELTSLLVGHGIAVADMETDALGAANAARGTPYIGVVEVPVSEGFTEATRRRLILASLADVRLLVVAVGGAAEALGAQSFAGIKAQSDAFAGKLGVSKVVVIPVATGSGLDAKMPWHAGPTLAEVLAAPPAAPAAQPFRFVIETVEASPSGQTSVTGTISRGSAQAGDAVAVLPDAVTASIAAIHSLAADGAASGPQRARIVLDGAPALAPGNVVCARGDRPEVSDQVAAHVMWLGDHPMLPGRPYDFECAGQRVSGSITTLKHRIDADLDHLAAKHLDKGDIGFCNLGFSQRIVFEPHSVNGLQGLVTAIDRQTRDIVGIGFIRFGLWRATNVHWQALDINKVARAESKGQKPCCLWFTGLSGSGKSTIANLLEKRLHAEGRHTYILDGDNVRHGLNRDLGFTDEDRVENIRRVSEVARLFVDAGLIVMVSFISPFRAERRMARGLIGDNEFMEIFVDTPLAVCEERDPKGLYKKARQGIIKNFTGIDSGYEAPENPEIRLKPAAADPGSLVDEIYGDLKRRGVVT